MPGLDAIVAIDPATFPLAADRNTALLASFHRLCEVEFDAHELESLDSWLESLGGAGAGAAMPNSSGEQSPITTTTTNPEFYPVFAILPETSPPSSSSPSSAGEAAAAAAAAGGIVLEVYPLQKICLLAYVVVAPSLRGQGAATLLVDFCRRWADAHFPRQQEGVAVGAACPLLRDPSAVEPGYHEYWRAALVVEVLQLRCCTGVGGGDGDDDGGHAAGSDAGGGNSAPSTAIIQQGSKYDAAVSRQRVWRRMGFLPLNVDLIHPPPLKGGRYNVALLPVAAAEADADASSQLLMMSRVKDQVMSWLRLFFRLIISGDGDGTSARSGSHGGDASSDDDASSCSEDYRVAAERHLEGMVTAGCFPDDGTWTLSDANWR